MNTNTKMTLPTNTSTVCAEERSTINPIDPIAIPNHHMTHILDNRFFPINEVEGKLSLCKSVHSFLLDHYISNFLPFLSIIEKFYSNRITSSIFRTLLLIINSNTTPSNIPNIMRTILINI